MNLTELLVNNYGSICKKYCSSKWCERCVPLLMNSIPLAFIWAVEFTNSRAPPSLAAELWLKVRFASLSTINVALTSTIAPPPAPPEAIAMWLYVNITRFSTYSDHSIQYVHRSTTHTINSIIHKDHPCFSTNVHHRSLLSWQSTQLHLLWYVKIWTQAEWLVDALLYQMHLNMKSGSLQYC